MLHRSSPNSYAKVMDIIFNNHSAPFKLYKPPSSVYGSMKVIAKAIDMQHSLVTVRILLATPTSFRLRMYLKSTSRLFFSFIMLTLSLHQPFQQTLLKSVPKRQPFECVDWSSSSCLTYSWLWYCHCFNCCRRRLTVTRTSHSRKCRVSSLVREMPKLYFISFITKTALVEGKF